MACMIELEQFDKSIESFARLGVRVVAISNDQAEKAREVQARFPSLRVVSDPDWEILEPLGFVDAGRARGEGGDGNVVEVAKAHGPLLGGVMTRRT